MKVIDLLNKKANGEELPSEINCYNQAFYLSDGIYIAKNQVGKYFEDYFDFSSLDYEVEIIENIPKEDKKIEKLDFSDWWEITSSEDCKPERLAIIFNKNAKAFSRKINEIIDRVNG